LVRPRGQPGQCSGLWADARVFAPVPADRARFGVRRKAIRAAVRIQRHAPVGGHLLDDLGIVNDPRHTVGRTSPITLQHKAHAICLPPMKPDSRRAPAFSASYRPRRDRLFLGVVLALSSAAGLAMLAFRGYYAGTRGYSFMV